jgi:(E)-4-hydroxy-3-methylbut-2-enyl-diphosphate synthase
MKYCESTSFLKRRPTREVMVGNVGVGGSNPIRIQSMTTSNTRDAQATIEQVMRLADIGCEIVRVTVQGMKEAESCEEIKNGLIQKGYNIPLVADIHFFPPAALRVIDSVDKVRINPGNFVDKRASFKVIEYDDESYAKEMLKIEEKFVPLVEKCKRLKKAMRIGTNHGSLSDRILNRYGDTPAGMVESALEYARVCRKHDFHDFIFSMKSSNPQVMVLAYRLLVAEMYKLGWDYPLHLGVTEAGLGEDGRIKSAMGIGTLLLEGLGDTIRVSLTEDPWHEIDPCKRLIAHAEKTAALESLQFNETKRDFTNLGKRDLIFPKNISMHTQGSVIVSVGKKDLDSPQLFKKLGCDEQLGRPKLKLSSADLVYLPDGGSETKPCMLLKEMGMTHLSQHQLLTIQDFEKINVMNKFSLNAEKPVGIIVENSNPEDWEKLKKINFDLLVLKPKQNYLYAARQFFDWLKSNSIQKPVILNFRYDCSQEDLVIQAAADTGSLLCDSLGEGLWLEGPYDVDFLRNLSFSILQAARMRIFKTDFISCPSCGRTLFDLQDVTKRIKSRTEHLAGVKIAIMGCIVNGPGEMADADFGYVGSKAGMIDLYIGKECVQKDIPFAEADDKLVELIKSQGKWQEPAQEEALI